MIRLVQSILAGGGMKFTQHIIIDIIIIIFQWYIQEKIFFEIQIEMYA